MANDDFIRTPKIGAFGKVNHVWEVPEWPPPEKMLYVEGVATAAFVMVDDPDVLSQEFRDQYDIWLLERVRYSKLTEEELVELTHVARGAEYRILTERTAKVPLKTRVLNERALKEAQAQ